jgi:hypothetical protein
MNLKKKLQEGPAATPAPPGWYMARVQFLGVTIVSSHDVRVEQAR